MTVQAGASVPWLRVSVVIPALNEARNLPHVFARLPPEVHEVIVVDGHSVDDTIAVARQLRPDVRIVLQTRRGKGNALACGFAAATGDIIAMIDADGSADPAEIPRFVQALVAGADFAKGTRFAPGGGSEDITRLRALGNRVLAASSTCATARATPTCATATTRSGGGCVPVLGLDADSPPPPNGGRAVGRRLRGGDLDPPPGRRGRAEGRRGAELRALTDPRCEQPQRGPMASGYCGRSWPSFATPTGCGAGAQWPPRSRSRPWPWLQSRSCRSRRRWPPGRPANWGPDLATRAVE